ncbi:putative lipoprotein [Pseudodesulfovibrio mercurii]|uniref:Putative lipoprotein n=1 Tax=Pseudodesulfovibrio mercurii TaxID=641491 RepID=F0JEF9_9BACT|nr:hypothetical protein [Pseudodesulfovibrio mercurii]EGB13522.1 putative lipoprotein [Pseudodesulfovibrio mercurii]
MRRYLFLFFIVCCLLSVRPVLAGQVQVFEPMAEGMSQRDLRDKARAQGFAQAVLDEAKGMLSNKLPEERVALLKEYLLGHAEPFIQGYKIVSSQAFPEGLGLTLDVRVDRRSLRDSLGGMGLFATLSQPQAATVVWPGDLSDEEVQALQHLVKLTGIAPAQGASPVLTMERGADKGTWKCRLSYDGQEWMAVSPDMAKAWFDLWPRFFDRPTAQAARTGGETLTVSGWFSPDGVLEFDRVLHGWDSAVQNAQLAELDMQPSGAGAVWTLSVINRDRLEMLLNAFLPQRGLSFHLAAENRD